MADFRFNRGAFDLASGNIDLDASTLKVLLVSTAWLNVANREDQDFVLFAPNSSQSPSAFEPSTTTGYGRQTLAGKAVTEVDASNRVDVDANDVTFAAVSSGAGVIGAAVIFAELAASDSSGRVLLTAYESGFPVTPNGGDITLSFSTGGFLQLTT